MKIYNIFICYVTFLYISVTNSSNTKEIVKARVESCPGCQLNRLTEVKQFIFEDVPNYADVEFKKISGAPPELVFLSSMDEEIERIELKSFNRKQCNQLLKDRGFKLNDNQEL